MDFNEHTASGEAFDDWDAQSLASVGSAGTAIDGALDGLRMGGARQRTVQVVLWTQLLYRRDFPLAQPKEVIEYTRFTGVPAQADGDSAEVFISVPRRGARAYVGGLSGAENFRKPAQLVEWLRQSSDLLRV